MTTQHNGKTDKVNVQIKYVDLNKIIQLQKKISKLRKELSLLV